MKRIEIDLLKSTNALGAFVIAWHATAPDDEI